MNLPLMTDLRTHTGQIHAKIHELPYFRSIEKKQLTAFQYANHLHALAIIWCSIEHELRTSSLAETLKLSDHAVSKWPYLQADIRSLRIRNLAPQIVDRTLNVVSEMLLAAAENPLAMIGYLYVMQGSMNGAAILREKIVEAIGNDQSTSYFNIAPESVKANWTQFGDMVNSLQAGDHDREAILAAARQIFSGLHDLFAELGKITTLTGSEIHITAINPEAGSHSMPDNPQLISAALRAGMKAWAEYPYLKLRYGERGMRFAKSDSCWLATLPALAQPEIDIQITWLARLLSARGIPSIILVRHLQILGEAMTEVNPSDEAAYTCLVEAGKTLFSQQTNSLPFSEFSRFADDWQSRLTSLVNLPKNSGQVLLSDYLDQKRNQHESAENALGWYEKTYFNSGKIQEELARLLKSF